jgi:hypothetical protein
MLVTFFNFDKVTVSEDTLLKEVGSSQNVFRGPMAIVVTLLAVVLILERYISRSDTKPLSEDASIEVDQQKFFKDEVFAKGGGKTQMTVRLQTFATDRMDV